MIYSKLVGGVATALIILTAGSTFTLACAGGFMQALLFQQYPKAKVTSIAISKARMRGTLSGDKWNKISGKSLHAWRAERTMVTINTLQDRFNSAVRPSTALTDTNVLLLNEFTWLRITTGPNRISVSRRPYSLRMRGLTVFTSRRVLDNVFDGAITWQQAINQGLIASQCKDNCSGQRFGLLGLAMAQKRAL
ncbi:MAG: hypothetical protein ACR2OY_04465 [Boseongicola sp.]